MKGNNDLKPREGHKSSVKASASFVVLINILMVLGGTCSTIFSKMLGQHVEIEGVLTIDGDGNELYGAIDTEFKHPLLMNFLMFIGEALLLVILHLQLKSDPSKRLEHQRNKANPIIFAVPALLDTLGSFCCFTGLSILAASTYQILKMLSMVFVVFLSVSMLGRRYSLTHYFAVILIILGLSVVSFDSIFGTSEVDSSTGN